MRVVLIGFGPFPGAPCNPSAILVKALARRRRPALAQAACTAHVLPTSYAAIDYDLPKLLALKPDIVLMFGLAARRNHLCIETRARNAVSVLFPDARGYRPQRGVIAPGRQAALQGAVPFAALLGALRAYPVPARMSRDAGRYLCNYAYWHALERVRGAPPLVQFVHIPSVGLKPRPRRQNGPRRVTLATLVAAAETLLIALMTARRR